MGYLITGIKDPQKVRVGDTITSADYPTAQPFPGYQPPQPTVFTGLYPVKDYKTLKEALQKLTLNDPSFQISPETSDALDLVFVWDSWVSFIYKLSKNAFSMNLASKC